MVAVSKSLCQYLVSPASLPPPSIGARGCQLSVLTYNVLLPNSQDGWWNYKMYLPPLSPEEEHISRWEHRRSLLRERIGLVDADVVCLQEVSPLSFGEDFAFMSEDLGYDGVELFRKGRFRPATFWKKDRVKLAAPAVHKDRTLLTTFQILGGGDSNGHTTTGEYDGECLATEGNEDENSKQSANNQKERKNGNDMKPIDDNWHVLNCHLQAGKQGGRRVRQILEGVKASLNLAKKLKEADPQNLKLIACGDFNGGSESGAVRLLSDGIIGPDFLEDGEQVSSKEKVLPLSSPLIDAVDTDELDRDGAPPPPTLVVPELISLMFEKVEDESCYEDPHFSQDLLDRFERIYESFATVPVVQSDGVSRMQMGKSDAERWLALINLQVGRGSEFRTAAKSMGWVAPQVESESDDENKKNNDAKKKAERPPIVIPDDGILSLEGFKDVYLDELRQGKFWGIAWDLARLGESLPVQDVFEARYDRVYCSSSLRPVAVMDTVSTLSCPNKAEPSDHLPVAVSFQVR